MKKTLMTLVAAVALALGMASCGSTDCVCTVGMDKNDTDTQVVLPVMEDWDGDCSDITDKDIADTNWNNVVELGGFIDCVED